MAIPRLNLNAAREGEAAADAEAKAAADNESAATEATENADAEAETTADKAKNTGVKKSGKRSGRPKGTVGPPKVTRTLRIDVRLDKKLKKKQKETGLTFNAMANQAFDAYLKDIK